jgi:hypothetical protein
LTKRKVEMEEMNMKNKDSKGVESNIDKKYDIQMPKRKKGAPVGNCNEFSKNQENDREEVEEISANKEKDKILLKSKVSHNM